MGGGSDPQVFFPLPIGRVVPGKVTWFSKIGNFVVNKACSFQFLHQNMKMYLSQFIIHWRNESFVDKRF